MPSADKNDYNFSQKSHLKINLQQRQEKLETRVTMPIAQMSNSKSEVSVSLESHSNEDYNNLASNSPQISKLNSNRETFLTLSNKSNKKRHQTDFKINVISKLSNKNREPSPENKNDGRP